MKELLLDFIPPILIAVTAATGYYYGIRRRAKQYCAWWGMDFDKFWPDAWHDRINFGSPCWEYKYLLPGRRKAYIEEVKRELRYINRELEEVADKMDGHINALNDLSNAIGEAINKRKEQET